MNIIHLSDIHFGNPGSTFHHRKVAERLAGFINEQGCDSILAISGDITFQGQKEGYDQGLDFFDVLFSKCGLERNNVIACPGNHDISSNSFNDFDRFIYSIRRDDQLSFSGHGLNVIEFDNVVFLILNTAYHVDHSYGLVDQSVLGDCPFGQYEEKIKVAMFHHHILGQFHSDTSAIRNSYNLVQWLVSNNVSYVFHGHQHSEQDYMIGANGMRVFSVRSGNFLQPGHINAFNNYSFVGGELCRRVFAFEDTGGQVGIREVLS